jgi:hypothetical protein
MVERTPNIGSLPRHFIPAPGKPSQTLGDELSLPLNHVVDTFWIGSRHLIEREWIVAGDIQGALHFVSAEERSDLPPTLQTELSHNEVSRNRSLRMLDVQELYLFSFPLMEQPGDTTGPNDPVYLYGTLSGPFPGTSSEGAVAVEGQLTVTCADVLEGFVQGDQYSFQYAESPETGGRASRCFHLMLPAGREEEVAEGKAIVLAYPILCGGDANVLGPSNEFLVKQLLHNLLGELKEDFEKRNIAHPLRRFVLPVPSRWALEQQLQSEGYLIDGDKAVEKVGDSAKGIGRVLSSLFGEEKTLPPEGSVEDFLRIAHAALAAVPGWPSARARAVKARVAPFTGTPRSVSVPKPPMPQPAKLPNAPPMPPPTAARPARKASSEPPAWMHDFIEAHKSPGSRASRVTSAWDSESRRPLQRPTSAQPTDRGLETAPTKSKKRQEWMKDFDSQPKATSPKKKKSGERPEWMNDFKK